MALDNDEKHLIVHSKWCCDICLWFVYPRLAYVTVSWLMKCDNSSNVKLHHRKVSRSSRFMYISGDAFM